MNYTGLSAKIAEYIAERAKAKKMEDDEKFNPTVWLTDAAKRAKQISFVTHALKYTHQDAKGTSIKIKSSEGLLLCKEFLCTNSFKSLKNDLVGNAAALDVGKLLLLEADGKKLLEFVEDNDGTPFRPFANTDKQISDWLEGFNEPLRTSKPASHKLSKQIYFPVPNRQYHLLSPLFSSSLCNAMDERIRKARYSEEMKEIRTAKKKGVFSEKTLISFPDLAIQTFGGTKPQNISQLNTERGGKTFLLNCTPPTWNTIKRPPLNTESIFRNGYFGRKVYRDISELKAFLETNLEKNSNLRIRSRRTKAVDSIIDKLFQYAAEIQNLTEFQGWSMTSDCKLSEAEKLWLDPLRSKFDQEFANKREQKNWCSEIARNFSKWFNSQLRYKSKLSMGDAELIEWQKLVEKEMAQLKEDLEDFA